MSKPFARFATALAIEDLLERIPNRRTSYITDMFPNWSDLHSKLSKYKRNEIGSNSVYDEVRKSIIDQAKETGSWDMDIYTDYLEYKKIVDMFYFLPYIQDEKNWESEEDTQMKRKLVATLLIAQKRNWDNYELVEKKPEVVAVEEPVEEEVFDYYQPEIEIDGTVVGHENEAIIYYHEVWKDKNLLMETYPNCNPIGYMNGYIPHPTFVTKRRNVVVTA